MAKKKPIKQRDEGKTRFELRFDEDLYERVKEVAEVADISVNQLMQGIARWAVENAHPGEEARYGEAYPSELDLAPQPGVVWFGHDGDVIEDSEGTPRMVHPHIFFSLDFTERRVIREEPRPRNMDKETD